MPSWLKLRWAWQKVQLVLPCLANSIFIVVSLSLNCYREHHHRGSPALFFSVRVCGAGLLPGTELPTWNMMAGSERTNVSSPYSMAGLRLFLPDLLQATLNGPKGPNLEKFQVFAWNFQSRLKFSISLENFNLDLQNSPQKIGVCGWLARNFQSRLKISRSWNFSRFGLLGGPFLTTRATIYRSFRALRAQNRKKVSKRVFLGSAKKSPKVPEKLKKYPQKVQFWVFWDFFGFYFRGKPFLKSEGQEWGVGSVAADFRFFFFAPRFSVQRPLKPFK